jgi:hypothetical protein
LENFRNFIQIHPWTISSQHVEGELEDKSNPKVRRWPEASVSHAAVDGGGRASEVVPM